MVKTKLEREVLQANAKKMRETPRRERQDSENEWNSKNCHQDHKNDEDCDEEENGGEEDENQDDENSYDEDDEDSNSVESVELISIATGLDSNFVPDINDALALAEEHTLNFVCVPLFHPRLRVGELISFFRKDLHKHS